MRYKIKITTFENGRQEFSPFVKTKWGWLGLDYRGAIEPKIFGCYKMNNRSDALHAIDLNFHGNKRVQRIEFEFINKTNPWHQPLNAK